MGANGDHITSVQVGDIAFDRQGTGVFSGVEKDRGDLAAKDHAACPFVGHMGNVIAGVPEHRIDGALAGAAGSHHITDVGHGMAFFFQACDGLQALWIAGLEHRQGMDGDVRPGGGVGGRRQIVRVGFAFNLEDRHGDALGQFGLGGEPLGCGPAVHNLLGEAVVRRQIHHFVEGVVDEQRSAESLSSTASQRSVGVLQQLDQSGDVVSPHHRSQQPGGLQW